MVDPEFHVRRGGKGQEKGVSFDFLKKGWSVSLTTTLHSFLFIHANSLAVMRNAVLLALNNNNNNNNNNNIIIVEVYKKFNQFLVFFRPALLGTIIFIPG